VSAAPSEFLRLEQTPAKYVDPATINNTNSCKEQSGRHPFNLCFDDQNTSQGIDTISPMLPEDNPYSDSQLTDDISHRVHRTASDNDTIVFITPFSPLSIPIQNCKYRKGCLSTTGVDNPSHGVFRPPTERQKRILEAPLTSSSSLYHRRPGRPRKVKWSAQNPDVAPLPLHSAVTLRRQLHNASDIRSRSRLNNVIEGLWNAIPRDERVRQLRGRGKDVNKSKPSRASAFISGDVDIRHIPSASQSADILTKPLGTLKHL
jgi:hypothetical protein